MKHDPFFYALLPVNIAIVVEQLLDKWIFANADRELSHELGNCARNQVMWRELITSGWLSLVSISQILYLCTVLCKHLGRCLQFSWGEGKLSFSWTVCHKHSKGYHTVFLLQPVTLMAGSYSCGCEGSLCAFNKGAFFHRDGNFNRLPQQVSFKIPVWGILEVTLGAVGMTHWLRSFAAFVEIQAWFPDPT